MPKTITDIIPPSRRKAMEIKQAPQMDVSFPAEESGETPPQYPRPMGSHKRGFPWKYAIAAVVVVLLAAGILHAFAGAKVEVTPVINQTAVSGEFAATSSAGDLSFELITAETTVSGSVPAEGTVEANDSAQGKITIYNAQSSPQQLIKNTRFESPQGLIFRIRDSVSVPGGTPTAPGTLEVTVYADQGGEEYNIAPASFTVPGLKGSATFDLVYARSSSAMSGGFSGTRASVSEATKTSRYEEMKPSIDAELRKALEEEVPEDYILLPCASWITYESLPDGAASGTVTLNQRGVVTAVVFPRSALAAAIASRTLGNYSGQVLTIEEPGTLTLASLTGSAPAAGDTAFSFTLSGNTNIKWVVDPSKIASAIAGKGRSAASTILLGFPEVEKVQAVLRPFWAGSYPENPEDIEVNVVE